MKKSAVLAGLASICGVTLLGLPKSANAEDWIVPGTVCYGTFGDELEVGIHDVTYTTGLLTHATCPLTKTLGANNVQRVWIRWERVFGQPSQAGCSVVTSTNLGEHFYGTTSLPAASAPQFTELNLPSTIQDRGHLSVACDAEPGFRILGIRYQQD